MLFSNMLFLRVTDAETLGVYAYPMETILSLHYNNDICELTRKMRIGENRFAV